MMNKRSVKSLNKNAKRSVSREDSQINGSEQDLLLSNGSDTDGLVIDEHEGLHHRMDNEPELDNIPNHYKTNIPILREAEFDDIMEATRTAARTGRA